MGITAKLDHYGRPAWIGLMILGFIIFWPIGLAILAYLRWSGRMGGWKHSSHGRWHYFGPSNERAGSRGWSWACGPSHHRGHSTQSSGNHAFDEYREETLRRLEDEQQEFDGFLERLRQARDKAEFDQFMDDRRRNAVDPEAPEAENKSDNPEAAPNGYG